MRFLSASSRHRAMHFQTFLPTFTHTQHHKSQRAESSKLEGTNPIAFAPLVPRLSIHTLDHYNHGDPPHNPSQLPPHGHPPPGETHRHENGTAPVKLNLIGNGSHRWKRCWERCTV